jgi:hypothetical protein
MNTKSNSGERRRWIGLANVRPLPGNDLLGQANGAAVALVAEACSTSDFLRCVERQLLGLQFELVSLEDVELLEERVARHQLPASLLAAVAAISEDEPIALGSFHAYTRSSTGH